MDQIKIGKFLASTRKEKGLTQAELAEQLGITDRAVSKWENGRSCPDAGLMMQLCSILGISANELLSGEHISMEDYKAKSEKTILDLKDQNEQYSRELLRVEMVLGITATVTFLVLVYLGVFSLTGDVEGLVLPSWFSWFLIVLGSVIFLVGVWFCLVIERKAGWYLCTSCGKTYVPEMSQVLLAPHMGRDRRMTCPYCGKRCWAKKTLRGQD